MRFSKLILSAQGKFGQVVAIVMSRCVKRVAVSKTGTLKRVRKVRIWVYRLEQVVI